MKVFEAQNIRYSYSDDEGIENNDEIMTLEEDSGNNSNEDDNQNQDLSD